MNAALLDKTQLTISLKVWRQLEFKPLGAFGDLSSQSPPYSEKPSLLN